MDVSFGTLWEAVAAALPGEIAISEPGRELTYAEFEDSSARLAAALAEAGVGPGDKVACYLFNGAAYLQTVFAAFKIGAVPVNANYRYTGEELSALLADADAAALVFSGELAGKVAHAARHVSTLRLLVRAEPGDGPDARDLDELLAATPPRPAAPRPGTDQLFMYTGGTTGTPKGVIWRLADLLHSLAVPIFGPLGVAGLPASPADAVRVAVTARREGRAPVTMPVVPLMHGTGLFNSVGALLAGGRVVTLGRGLDPRRVWETVAAQAVGMIIVAGNAVCGPLVAELRNRAHDLTPLRSVLSSGTALSDRLKRALHERTEVTIIDAIASSEGGPFAFAITSSVRDLPSRFRPVPGTTVLTEDGHAAAPGEVGTLAYRGPMPLGYYKDSAKTAATFRVIDGVRYTMPGDLAAIEPDGAIRFLGRGSGVINTGGEKVHAHEVEEALLAHPDVTDAVVVGVPDETWGERVCAVVATANTALTAADLREAVRGRLAGYKIPRRIVLLPGLRRTPTGKLELAWAREVVDSPALPRH
ncbi:AMP-binding protein [Amycolatopsis sp. K13G38]|uniref:AMP-binding protein n=1 Tax=Amycolatopsis acididurans TaxID=2724524 RepID=A0ABX1IVB0_9PSEU|nr:AMP-binding protein [Amycolatopsis acididurans]NKQ51420.1 AMP-binding protein [Amycolatopsis acididurans]